MVCFDEDIFDEEDEELVNCSECSILFIFYFKNTYIALLIHPSCYGLGESVSSNWLCQECIAKKKNVLFFIIFTFTIRWT